MPFQTVKLAPGVRAEQTPLLLQAGVVQSNNIRWKDGLPEKLGGWQKFYYGAPKVTPPAQAGPIRAMWPWADFNDQHYLAAGGDAGLFIVTQNRDITPQFNIFNVSPSFSTVAGSSLVHIFNDQPGSITHIRTNGSVVIGNYVIVGGLLLYGAYAVEEEVSLNEIVIDAGKPATSTVSNGGAVSAFTTFVGNPNARVTLPGHSFVAGSTYFALATTLTGSMSTGPDIVVGGSYEILEIVDGNTFTIALGATPDNAVGPIGENGGKVRLTYWVVSSPARPGGGWGTGGWGTGGWGGVGVTIEAVGGVKLTAANIGAETLDWCLTNFGEDLIAQPQGYGFFRWDHDGGLGCAQPISEAPLNATGFFLAMPSQQLVAYGAATAASGESDPMLVRWCDNADYRSWVAAADNQAGSYRLTRGSRIVGGLQAPMQAMLWTDVGFWLMTYIGYPDVYGFSEVAQECGLIAKKACAVCGPQTFWMGRDKFWTFANGQVQPLPCEVWDAVFQNLNTDLLDRIRCGANTGFDEVWWFFPSLATREDGALQENDSYVKVNRVTGEWDYGTPVDVFGGADQGGLTISDWIDANVFGHPISAMTQSDGVLSQLMWMEMGRDADIQAMPWWFRTGLFLLSEGEDIMFVDRCRPDFRWRKFADDPATVSAAIQITLYTQDEGDNPTKPPAVYGPFVCTASSGPFDPRCRGRYFSLKVEGDDVGSFARLGGIKFRFCPDGRAG